MIYVNFLKKCLDMDPHYVDVEDKADWSSRIETVFIRIRVPGVKPYLLLSSDEDRELEENFLSHGVHVDIDDDDSMEPLFETRTEKRPRRPVATSTERGKKNKSEFDSYFKMASSVMNTRIEMVKCKSAKSTSQCVEKCCGEIGRH
ncbi:hypothetical protein CUMW_189800 [Citrus unshiu]|nr:hypothetical protein CUMW_189800 [Citrus unshiu]